MKLTLAGLPPRTPFGGSAPRGEPAYGVRDPGGSRRWRSAEGASSRCRGGRRASGPKAWAVAAALLGLALLCGPPAGATIIPLSNKTTDDEFPQINLSGNVAWQGWNGQNWKVFFWDGTKVQEPVNNYVDDLAPLINDAGHMVWQHWDGVHWQIFYWSASGGVAPYTNNGVDHVNPRISSGNGMVPEAVVWQGWDPGSGHWRLRRYESTTGTVAVPTTTDGGDDVNPRVNNAGQVVWEHWDATNNCWQVYYWDGTNLTALTSGAGDSTEAQINNASPPQVTWQHWDGSEWEIYLWKSGGSSAQITTAATNTTNLLPQISDGGLVVWQRWDGSHWQIEEYNSSNSTTTAITSGSADNTHPQVNAAGYITWEFWDGAHWQIEEYNPNGNPQIGQVTTDAADHRLPQINNASSPQIAYQAWNGANEEVYLYTPGGGGMSLAVAPSGVAGGDDAVGTVVLPSAAPAGGATVTLSSSNTAVAGVPASVTVAQGAATATFTVTSTAITSATAVTITATYTPPGGSQMTATASLTVNPPVPVAVQLSPSPVAGTVACTGTVTLNGPAPSGGQAVTLSSSNTSVASVPSAITVASGQTSGTFPVTTYNQTAPTTVTITATASGSQVQQSLTVLPNSFATNSLTLSPTTVTAGNSSTGTVTLTAAAPTGGTTVALSLSNGDSIYASVPPSVTVAAGQTSATFTVSTYQAPSLPASVTINASYGGVMSTASLGLQAPTLAGVSIVGPTSVPGGTTATGKVTLSGPAPSGGITVTLSSDNAAATVSNSPPFIVPEGSTAATFPITTGTVSSNMTANIKAIYGSANFSTPLTVQNSPFTLSLNPSSVAGGQNCTGTITLASPAPSGGATVTLSTDTPAVAGLPSPPQITIPQGSSAGTFTITTAVVPDNQSVVISASYSSVTQSSTLQVTPPVLASTNALTIAPTSVAGGSGATGTVTLNAAAPSGGAEVTLASSSPAAASVPATVTVPAGQTSVTFTISTAPVAASASVTITATRLSASASQSLTVQPPSLQPLSPTSSTVTHGTPVTETVTLSDPAPAGGAVVALTSSNPAVANVPASVTVPAGATQVTFKVTTIAASGTAVTITASYLAASQQASVTVN